MNKSMTIHVVLIVVTVILGWQIAKQANKRQLEISPSLKKISKAPLGGMHKISSDVEWMRLIQYAGSQKTVDESNVQEHIRRIENIINLDPNFEKSYTVGVNMLAVQNPEKAVELLKKGCENEHLKDKWKIPFYAGFILTHHYPDDSRLADAVGFFEEAIKRSAGSPERYVVNALMRTKARLAYKEDKDKKTNKYVNENHAKLDTLYREWKKSKVSTDAMGEMDSSVSIIPDITDRLLDLAKKIKKESENDPKVLDSIDKVCKEVLVERRLCGQCLTPYGPGQKFCEQCANPVVLYGTCPKCGVIANGNFCGHCAFDLRNIDK